MAKQKVPAEVPKSESSPTGYTVLARRYRPQTFADLVGQGPVSRALTNALSSSRVAHAYLFTGARGVGKTSTARILAKALNCEKGPTDKPCGKCTACVGIAAGEDVDVLEIDGASNTGVDNIRELRSNAQYSPARSRFKIYIIDEVHMLSRGAFNALLKTLEEPPPHVKFIFATTEVEKVPVTVLSRCQRFDFPGIPLPQIVERLRTIVAAEGLQADNDALELVARRAGGSMRDAQSLLDQLLAFGEERLTADQVHHLLGTAGDDRIASLAEAILAADSKRALELLDEAVVAGLQLGELLDQLIAYWRDLMIVQVAGAKGQDLSVSSRLCSTLEGQAKTVGLDVILAGLDVLSAAKARLRGSSHGRTLVEMTLVRLGRLKDLVSVGEIAQWLTQAPTGTAVAPASREAAPIGVKKKPPVAELTTGPVNLNETTLTGVWAQALSMVGTIQARELERGGIPAIIAPNSLVLRFPAVYNQSREFCQEPERLSRVEDALQKVTGQPWKLRLETTPGNGAGTASSDSASLQSGVRPRRNDKDEAEKVPIIRRAVEVLGARILRTDEGFGAIPSEEK